MDEDIEGHMTQLEGIGSQEQVSTEAIGTV